MFNTPAYKPSQVLSSSDIRYPDGHKQKIRPIDERHVCEQPPLLCKHSPLSMHV